MAVKDKMIGESNIEGIFKTVLGGKPPYPHQIRTAKYLLEGRSVILRAPCGSGKTEACYVPLLLGKGDNLPDRLLYSLPTRALVEDVSERIKLGLSRVGSFSISTQHGANSQDPFFKSDIVVATIDQIISAYCCTPLSVPVHLGNIPAGASVSSFLCFDEAHIYDHSLGLQSIIVLVERAAKLGLPFLVMSATLPDSFIDWFENNELFSDNTAIVKGTEEDVPRRRSRHVVLRWMRKMLETEDLFNCECSWRRIMVVCNTVERAQEIYTTAKKPLEARGFNVYLLHSRFLEKDRETIENSMKSSIRNENQKTCLITTQVCEAGLDISCDLLLTEIAPPDSLVQRIGRCAREGKRGEVWVFDVKYCAPYSNDEIAKTRQYIAEKLDGKKIGWNEELEFINVLLNEEFREIMNDASRRNEILLSLGDAAFKGDRRKIESSIREILTANLTIYDAPEKLKYEEMLNMPWLSIDARVLDKHLAGKEYWRVNFNHDENGEPTFYLEAKARIYPYEYYVVHPNNAKYDPEKGLILGEKGDVLHPYLQAERKEFYKPSFERETWMEHAIRSLLAFEKVKAKEKFSIKILKRILRVKSYDEVEGLLALSVVVHDLGKLNKEWQNKIGVKDESAQPLAHIPLKAKVPPHAAVSAHSTYMLFKQLIPNSHHALAFKLAIAHHHHTRVDKVNPYNIGWANFYRNIISDVCQKYSLDIDLGSIQQEESIYRALETPLLNFESLSSYSAYCIIARVIRLSDWESFNVKIKNY